MADAEAIREARRQRILKSSESRMNRFTGRMQQGQYITIVLMKYFLEVPPV